LFLFLFFFGGGFLGKGAFPTFRFPSSVMKEESGLVQPWKFFPAVVCPYFFLSPNPPLRELSERDFLPTKLGTGTFKGDRAFPTSGSFFSAAPFPRSAPFPLAAYTRCDVLFPRLADDEVPFFMCPSPLAGVAPLRSTTWTFSRHKKPLRFSLLLASSSSLGHSGFWERGYAGSFR